MQLDVKSQFHDGGTPGMRRDGGSVDPSQVVAAPDPFVLLGLPVPLVRGAVLDDLQNGERTFLVDERQAVAFRLLGFSEQDHVAFEGCGLDVGLLSAFLLCSSRFLLFVCFGVAYEGCVLDANLFFSFFPFDLE